uniref:Putative DNA binding, helix-turn-helix domain containing protein n=1 Tax=viral metagenome TaxID=1070528 RepID=A0A6M3LN97_9ZZZZ
MDDMERWKEETVLTLVEVVRVLRLSRNTIIRLVRDGKLNGKKVGKQWRISTSSVVNLLDQLEKSHG